jgi:hypothetical protein
MICYEHNNDQPNHLKNGLIKKLMVPSESAPQWMVMLPVGFGNLNFFIEKFYFQFLNFFFFQSYIDPMFTIFYIE